MYNNNILNEKIKYSEWETNNLRSYLISFFLQVCKLTKKIDHIID